MSDPLSCACSCCAYHAAIEADLRAQLHALADREAAVREERDALIARLPHGGYGGVHRDPVPPTPEPRRRVLPGWAAR